MAISTGNSVPYILEKITPFPLDGIDSGDFVYAGGFIQLRGDYSGFSVRIRRNSDNAETDISFKDRVADGAEMLAFGSDLFLVKIYDQVGTGVDWTNATASTQLTIATAGVLIESAFGIPGAESPGVGIKRADTSSFTMPKDFTSIDFFSDTGGLSLRGRSGTLSNINTNGFENKSFDNVGLEMFARIRSSAGAILASINLSDVVDPTNGVIASLYVDDTSGTGIYRNQDGESTPAWAAGSRTGVTAMTVSFNRVTSFIAPVTQHFSIMLNTVTDRPTAEARLKSAMGL